MESGISKYNLILGKISHLYQQHIQRIESQEVVQELDYELPYHTKVIYTHNYLLVNKDNKITCVWLEQNPHRNL